MTSLNTALLEHLLVDYAGYAHPEHIFDLTRELLDPRDGIHPLDPQAYVGCCCAILFVTIKAARLAGKLPDPADLGDAFYGVTVEPHEPGAENLPGAFGHLTAMRAFAAGLNNDWPAAVSMIAPLVDGLTYSDEDMPRSTEAISCFTHCLNVYREAASRGVPLKVQYFDDPDLDGILS